MARWQRKQRRTNAKRRLEPPPPTERPPWPAPQHPSSEPPASTSEPQAVVRKADVVVRLAYTPTQAAQALGVSRSSLYRFLPYLETIETPSGHPLIPVDELERLAAERRQAALAVGRPRRQDASRPFRRESSPASASLAASAGATSRSPPSSTRVECRPRTGVVSGGPRRCAPFSGAVPSLPTNQDGCGPTQLFAAPGTDGVDLIAREVAPAFMTRAPSLGSRRSRCDLDGVLEVDVRT